MSLTFKEVQANDAAVTLLNANEYAKTFSHIHPTNGTANVVGVLDEDALDVGMPGVINDKNVRVKDRAILELLASVDVMEERPGGANPSRFTADGVTWMAVRIVGEDEATQSVEVRKVDQKATKRI
jgi:hypothetical protein